MAFRFDTDLLRAVLVTTLFVGLGIIWIILLSMTAGGPTLVGFLLLLIPLAIVAGAERLADWIRGFRPHVTWRGRRFIIIFAFFSPAMAAVVWDEGWYQVIKSSLMWTIIFFCIIAVAAPLLRRFRRRINDETISQFSKSVTRLNLADADVTDDAAVHLGKCKNLRVLILRGTKITDRGLRELSGLHALRYLDVRDTNVTDNEISRLQTVNSRVDVVR